MKRLRSYALIGMIVILVAVITMPSFPSAELRDLRPVEALYLLDMAGKESITRKAALAATIAYLANEELIKPEGDWFVVTEKAKKVEQNLRDYERKCIKAIQDKAKKRLCYAISGYPTLFGIQGAFDFKGLMVKLGFLELKEILKKFWFWSWTETEYHTTKKFDSTIQELEKLEEEIATAIQQKKVDPYLMLMSYAFPSTGLSDGFLEFADDTITAVTRAASNATDTIDFLITTSPIWLF